MSYGNIIMTVKCKIQLVEIIIFTEATVMKTTEPGLTWRYLPDQRSSQGPTWPNGCDATGLQVADWQSDVLQTLTFKSVMDK